MGTKKFDRELYNKADPLSNGVMVKWLDKNGYEDIDPKETYGVDITCKIIDKWVQSGGEGTLTFVVFRPDCKQAWFIDGQAVRDSRIDIMSTRYSKDEKFYHIDVNDANLINMNIEVE